MPGGFPGGMPGGFSGGLPGGFPGGMPGGFPGGMPGGMPGSFPGSAPGGAPGNVDFSKIFNVRYIFRKLLLFSVCKCDPSESNVDLCTLASHVSQWQLYFLALNYSFLLHYSDAAKNLDLFYLRPNNDIRIACQHVIVINSDAALFFLYPMLFGFSL